MAAKPRRSLLDVLPPEDLAPAEAPGEEQTVEVAAPAAPEPGPEPQAEPVVEHEPSPAPAPPVRARPVRAVPDPPAELAPVPHYLQLARKETRLDPAAWDQATTLARTLQRRRVKPAGDPEKSITENTLLRVALQVLLDHGDQLAGNTEAELVESLRRAVRKPRTS